MAIRRKKMSEVDQSTKQESEEEFGTGKTPPEYVRSMAMRARTRTRQKWLEYQPKNEQTLVDCEECQDKLRELTWMSDDTHGFGYLEPVFEECRTHSDLFIQWVTDLTTTLNRLHQNR